jgi:hypothetical protein
MRVAQTHPPCRSLDASNPPRVERPIRANLINDRRLQSSDAALKTAQGNIAISIT